MMMSYTTMLHNLLETTYLIWSLSLNIDNIDNILNRLVLVGYILPDLVVELGVADLPALQFAWILKSLFFMSCHHYCHHHHDHDRHPDCVDQVALASDVSLRLCKGFTLLLLPARDKSGEI